MTFTDTELSQIDRAAERRQRDAEWRECKPTKWSEFVCYASFTDASKPVKRIEVQASSKADAINAVYGSVPPGTYESVSAWQERGPAKSTYDACSPRVLSCVSFDSAFGPLV